MYLYYCIKYSQKHVAGSWRFVSKLVSLHVKLLASYPRKKHHGVMGEN